MLNHIRTLFIAATLLSPLAVTSVQAQDWNKEQQARHERERQQGKKCENRAERRAERAERREHRHEHHKMHLALK